MNSETTDSKIDTSNLISNDIKTNNIINITPEKNIHNSDINELKSFIKNFPNLQNYNTINNYVSRNYEMTFFMSWDKYVNESNMKLNAGLLTTFVFGIILLIPVKSWSGFFYFLLIILLYALLQYIQYKGKTMQSILNSNVPLKIKETFIDVVKNSPNFFTEYTESEKDNFFNFYLKNYIDFTGLIDLTKPPYYIFKKMMINRRYKVIEEKNNETKLNNHVIVFFKKNELYYFDDETKRILYNYNTNICDHFRILFGKGRDLRDIVAFDYLREFNIWVKLSIIFLVFDYYISFAKSDNYGIVPRKIISMTQNLDTKEIREKIKPFQAKLINLDGEIIEFRKDEIYGKEEDKKIEEFNENYMKKLGEKDEYYKKINDLNIKINDELFNQKIEYLKITAKIQYGYKCHIIIKFDSGLKNVVFTWYGGDTMTITYERLDPDNTKESYVVKESPNKYIIYIKYFPFPLKIELLDNFKSSIEFFDKVIFGPINYYGLKNY